MKVRIFPPSRRRKNNVFMKLDIRISQKESPRRRRVQKRSYTHLVEAKALEIKIDKRGIYMFASEARVKEWHRHSGLSIGTCGSDLDRFQTWKLVVS